METDTNAPTSCNIYVNNLRSSDEEELRAALSQYGNVVDLFIKIGRGRATFAFASYEDVASAVLVCEASPIIVGSDSCTVEMRRSKPFDNSRSKPFDNSCNIYINHLNSADGETLNVFGELCLVLGRFGELTDVHVNKSKNYAFATFVDQEMAVAAVNASPLVVGSENCTIEMRHSRSKKNRL